MIELHLEIVVLCQLAAQGLKLTGIDGYQAVTGTA